MSRIRAAGQPIANRLPPLRRDDGIPENGGQQECTVICAGRASGHKVLQLIAFLASPVARSNTYLHL